MPHMLGYLGGDSNTLVARSAKENDIKMAVEFVGQEKMLVVCVMQTGEVMVTFTDTHDSGDTCIMHVVGHVKENTNGELYYLTEDQVLREERPAPVTFKDQRHLTPVSDEYEGDD